MKDNKVDKASEIFNEMLKTNPKLAEPHYFLGNIAAFRKDYKQAINEFETALKLNPYYTFSYNSLGNLYYEMKDFENAEKAWQKVIELSPTDPGSSITYINLIKYYSQKDKAKAGKIAKQFIQNGGQLPQELKDYAN